MQEFSSEEQRKLIWIVVAFCFSIVALLGVITLAVFALFFPLPYAKMLQGVGLNNLALSVYQDVYANSKDVKDGYAYLMESIYAKYDKHIVIAYEMIKEDEQFSTFLTEIDIKNVEKFGATKNLLGSLDELDYVSGKYVSSLCNMGESKKAFDFALADLQQNNINFSNQNNKKTFLMFDYIASNKEPQYLTVVNNEVQNDISVFESSCELVVDNFKSKTTYTVGEFALALECAVRCVEVYKSLETLNNAGVQTNLSKEIIAQNKDGANKNLASVLKKAVK